MGNSMSVWAENISNSGFTVVGRLNNNGYTYEYSGCRFTLSVNGSDIYDQYLTFSAGENKTFSAYYNCGTSSSNRTFTIKSWWDSTGFGYVDSNSATASVTVYASVYSAKAPTNCSSSISGTTATVKWSHGGNESSYPCSGFEISYDGFSTKTSVSSSARSATITVPANGAYTFQIRALGSAGNSSRVDCGTVYSTPTAPTFYTVNGTTVGTAYDSSKGANVGIALGPTYQVNISFNSLATYSNNKTDLQWSTNGSTWYGTGGSTSAVYSLTGKSAVNISGSTIDSTLQTQLTNCRNAKINGTTVPTLYFRVRQYATNNSTPSAWSVKSQAATVSLNPQLYFQVPDGTTIRKTDGTPGVVIYVKK